MDGDFEFEPRRLGPGIEVAPGVDNCIITSNIVRDNATGQIVQSGLASRRNRIIKDNLPLTP